jgi:hypothetical protein
MPIMREWGAEIRRALKFDQSAYTSIVPTPIVAVFVGRRPGVAVRCRQIPSSWYFFAKEGRPRRAA